MAKLTEDTQSTISERAGTIGRDILDFIESERVFSSDAPRLIDEYEGQWVAAYKGEIVASAETLTKLRRALEARDIPLPNTMIRRIEREKKTLIL